MNKKNQSEINLENEKIHSDIILWTCNYRNKLLNQYAGNHGIDFSTITSQNHNTTGSSSSSSSSNMNNYNNNNNNNGIGLIGNEVNIEDISTSTSHTRIGVYLDNDWPAVELEAYMKEISSLSTSTSSPTSTSSSTVFKKMALKFMEGVEKVEKDRDDKIENMIRKLEAEQVTLYIFR